MYVQATPPTDRRRPGGAATRGGEAQRSLCRETSRTKLWCSLAMTSSEQPFPPSESEGENATDGEESESQPFEESEGCSTRAGESESESVMEPEEEAQYEQDASAGLSPRKVLKRACAELVPPAERCISGGDVMTAFFSVLFGGLNFAQALPGLAAAFVVGNVRFPRIENGLGLREVDAELGGSAVAFEAEAVRRLGRDRAVAGGLAGDF